MAALQFYKQPTYLLCDSWYTSRQLIEAALRRGTHVIGALKTNRIIYPAGVRMRVKQFAAYLDEQDTDLVTIGQEQYRIYRDEGALHTSNQVWSYSVGLPMNQWKPNECAVF